ncbi:RNA polymerase sigma-70 factor [Flavobacterium sp. ZB4P23]|uniref:RNA polymerase sigma-70 factor n=1 Tax=Flavobacterium bomense TaxID=2497483 RepID=A0A3S0P1A7_9FLAO|nr:MULTISPECIES: RNA polymerase sigma-70 factor [Flavobacterium]RTY83692.1 RNA polymerase sigma-70 factor [Flavobacterium sp. ZB4P23]RTY91043.1 RNA polymerase sigma-70 factor [Flavobacterium sp. RSP46]RTZ05567.1 RNA polymerase sigma-70 factor [Flavobacterium bomense]RTZ06781.1 RNA polymerase sigma-70 factor [Flavobacterium sp. GSP6]
MKTTLLLLSDTELQTRLQHQDQLAFGILFDRYWKRLYTYAFKIYKEEAICEDIVQEIFISLWEKSANTSIENLEGYLLRAVKYKVANHIRDLKFDSGHLEILQNIPNPSGTDKHLVYQEFESEIFKQIKKLPPRSQEVIILSRLEHYTNIEIAQKLNISVRTVEKHISDGLKLLKMKIDPCQFSIFITGMLLQC